MAVRTVHRPVEPSRKLQFGRAVVRFMDQWYGDQSMVLADGVICLPDLPNLEFTSLANGRQFLCSSPSLYEVGFGGKDDAGPFLRRIDPEALKIVRDRGEQGFWRWLKPDVILAVERQTGRAANLYAGVFVWDSGLPWDQVELTGICLARSDRCHIVLHQPLYPPWATFTGNLLIYSGQLGGVDFLALGELRLPVRPPDSFLSVPLFKSVHLIACPLVYLDLADE